MAAALALGASIAVLWFLARPDGCYYAPHLSGADGVYLILEDGNVTLKNLEWERAIGRYWKSNGIWLMDGGTTLHPGVLGIKVIDPADSSLDRFYFRRGLEWLDGSDRLSP